MNYKTLILLAVVFFASVSAQAQVASNPPYTLDQAVIAGGGATSTGTDASGYNTFELSGTIGQSIAATSTNDVYTLEGGFWFADTYPPPPPPPSCALDVTSQLTITRGSFRRNLVTRRFSQSVTIQNNGSTSIQVPFAYVVDNLQPTAALYNPAGQTACAAPLGSAFVNANPSTGSELAAGASLTLTLEFTNNDPTQAITYTPRVLVGSNSR